MTGSSAAFDAGVGQIGGASSIRPVGGSPEPPPRLRVDWLLATRHSELLVPKPQKPHELRDVASRLFRKCTLSPHPGDRASKPVNQRCNGQCNLAEDLLAPFIGSNPFDPVRLP